jgi:transposase
MPARLHLARHLSEGDLFARYQAAPRPLVRAHWQVLWMVSQDWRTEDISGAIGYRPPWIRTLVGRYNEGAPEAMDDQRSHNPGGEKLLSADDEEDLRIALGKVTEQGDAWSGAQVARWMSARLGIPVRRQRGWETLRRLGYTPQRPRRRHADADPEAQVRFPG